MSSEFFIDAGSHVGLQSHGSLSLVGSEQWIFLIAQSAGQQLRIKSFVVVQLGVTRLMSRAIDIVHQP
jgi:hypothetical protein